MENEIDRLEAISSSSLARCRNPQLTFHFRAELAEFNVPGTGLPNPLAVKFKCKNSVRKKTTDSGKESKWSFSSTWKIRHPEMRPNGQIAVPISYEGDWSRAAVISLVFVVHCKKSQRIAYSKGEIVLIDDVCDDRFSVLMKPRHEQSCDNLKMPVMVHLLIDVWDVDAGNKRIRCARKSSVTEIPISLRELEAAQDRLRFERVDATFADSDECAWPASTDFLIEIPTDDSSAVQCVCNGSCNDRGKFDENANLVLSMERGHNCVQFFCHRSTLAKESRAFADIFSSDWTKEANVLRIRSVSPSAIQMFLNFLYDGQLCPIDAQKHEDGDARVEFEEIIEVVGLANRYEVDNLRTYCDSLLTDRYLDLSRAAESIMIAERYELPLLGQAALSLLSLSLDEDHLQSLINDETKHLITTVISEARKRHMFCTVVSPS